MSKKGVGYKKPVFWGGMLAKLFIAMYLGHV